MAGGILALAMKPKGGATSKPEKSGLEGDGEPEATLDPKAAALKAMWANMKAGDFEAAALDFQDAYMACAEADEPDSDDEAGFPDLGGGEETDEFA